MARGSKLLIGVVAVLALLIGGFLVWWFLIRDDAPAAVDIDDAVASLEDEDRPDRTAEPAAGEDGAETWSVDPTIGDFAEFTSSFVGYRVDEEVNPIGAQTAVGRTPEVTGELVIEGTTLTEVTIDADLTALQSDSGIRDGQLENRGLETASFPDATFVLTAPVDLETEAVDGARASVDAVGDLTLHGVTNEVTIPIDAELDGGILAVAGAIEFDMRDFDIEPPTGGPILEVDPNATVEVQLFFTAG